MTIPLPTETTLAGGLRDDVKSLAESVSDTITFRMILEHSSEFGVEDTFAVGTILHVPALYLHDTGERRKGKGRVNMFEAFRKEDKDMMMHLKDANRFKMVDLITTYLEKGHPRPSSKLSDLSPITELVFNNFFQ